MPRGKSRGLVIDADVAQSAGGELATHGRSRDCREFLQAVLDICHRVVFTTEISREWNDHQSKFSRAWRAQMMARKKIDFLKPNEIESVKSKLLETVKKKDDRQEIERDFHLIKAAKSSDGIIISCDDSMRSLLSLSIAEALGS